MKIKEEFFLHSVGDVHIVMQDGTSNVDFGRIISLNPTAVYLWERIGHERFDAGMLAGMLAERYGVTEKEALRDAEAFVEKLKASDVVTEEE
ncbi:PqqD family protein [Bacteroides heparinolyticus]|uniref:PqqD family protein n=1 Tax=Prevotella heparinolytica TaxID=28113 RepID=A0A3P2AFY0_9BACE|nr:PqqD family protein [Bacteroides heparinolyticus]RRD93100.1 PqqD family protein [Bacteroides heparinolyticus]